MCFSTGASFGAGVILSVIGVASIKKANKSSQIIFAGIPLIFCVQQVTEGFVWLSLSNPAFSSLEQVATYTFIFIAQVIWPIWIPIALLMLEEENRRKKIQKVLLGMGVVISLFLAYCLLNFHVEAKIIGYHIKYQQDYPRQLSRIGALFYIIATIAPTFVSAYKRMWILGVAVLISYIITTIFYVEYITSVWCFFASIISIAVYIILHEIIRGKKDHTPAEMAALRIRIKYRF